MTHVSADPSRSTRICHYCMEAPGITNDHIVPRVLGGPFSAWNIQPACRACNSQKTDKWPSCQCSKCQEAVAQFLRNPRWAAKAIRILRKRAEVIQNNIDSLQTIKLPRLLESAEKSRAELESLQELALTHSDDTDMVETWYKDSSPQISTSATTS